MVQKGRGARGKGILLRCTSSSRKSRISGHRPHPARKQSAGTTGRAAQKAAEQAKWKISSESHLCKELEDKAANCKRIHTA